MWTMYGFTGRMSTPKCNTAVFFQMTTKEAIAWYGSIKALAAAIDVWPHVISRWGEKPPMARQYELEVKTKGELKADSDDDQ